MHSLEKYNALRNFIHNELQITKEEIEIWVKEAVSAKVESLAKRKLEESTIIEIAVEKAITKYINGYGYGAKSLQDAIAAHLIADLKKKITLDVKIVS